MTKLSKAQQTMINRLSSGDRILVGKGINASAFYRGSMDSANINTIYALLDRGLVGRRDEDWRGYELFLKEKQS
jgi:hypothetical protein